MNTDKIEVDDWKFDQNNILQLVNRHRKDESTTTATLRLSVKGANVSKVHKEQKTIYLDLDDNSVIEIEHKELDNTSEYEFVWRRAGPSLDREVCFHYGFNNASWYSTYEEKCQHWPMDTTKHIDKGKAFTTGDFLHAEFGGIIEHLFANSDGFGVMLHHGHPWFVRRDPNHGDPLLCVAVSNQAPYSKLDKYDDDSGYFDTRFTVMTSKNIQTLYDAYRNPNLGANATLKAPKAIPDERIFRYPIWSTWAEYKKDINQTKVMDFAHKIKSHGFANAQLEIDDLWERHYGDFTFDTHKFPDPRKMVSELHALGFRVTVWVYPFVNEDSDAYEPNKNHFLKDRHGQPVKVNWWDGSGGVVDFSDETAAQWFVERLEHLRNETGLDSFKFDAGEINWFGSDFVAHDAHVQQYPNLLTTRYVETCAKLGGMIEVRAGYKSQELPIFVRMLDKASDWSIDNGLKSLVTTGLMMSLASYNFVLPDMIGGNAYGNKPTEELYIRWVQANTFLPSLQFSIPPWHYSEKTVNITKKYVELHVAHADEIIKQAKRFTEPLIRPMWYAEPEDVRTFTIADQFMLGNDIVVAPVLEAGQHHRQVYLPSGTWLDAHGMSHTGPGVITVNAPIEELPYFKRKH